MALIKKMSAPITQSAECVLHTDERHTCQYGVGGDKFRDTLAMRADTCKGVGARTHHTHIINYTSSKQSRFWPEKKLSPIKKVRVRQSETKREGESREAGEVRDGMYVSKVLLLTARYYWQSISQTICSLALSLCYIELWLLWVWATVRCNRFNKYLHQSTLQQQSEGDG